MITWTLMCSLHLGPMAWKYLKQKKQFEINWFNNSVFAVDLKRAVWTMIQPQKFGMDQD